VTAPTIDAYPVVNDRRIIARPDDGHLLGTTVLVVTVGRAGVYRVEAAKVTAEGFSHQRDVYEARTKREAMAFLEGNRWNPGGPISRPRAAT